jgi:hypothetical protein
MCYYDDEDLTKEEKDFFVEIEKVLSDIKRSEAEKEIYVCSFSSNPDQLSQWRGYCPDGNGYSIGFEFNSKMIEHINKNKHGFDFDLVKCIYAEQDQFPLPIQRLVVCQELCKISERAVAMAGTEILLNLTLRMTA